MRLAAHSMVRNLTAGMAMITCRDHLLQAIKSHLKSIMHSVGRVMLPNHMDTFELAVAVIANDNVELACAFIQKKAVEKAIPEIDKRLSVEIEHRKVARKEGRRYCDPVALTYQSERMPEPLRSKVPVFRKVLPLAREDAYFFPFSSRLRAQIEFKKFDLLKQCCEL